jgi:hypothetical protein
MNKVGLDGSICSEYICSLIELYAKSRSERDAAIADFLMDSVTASSSLRSIGDQSKFVEETVSEIRNRLDGQRPPVEPTSVVAPLPVEAPSSSLDSASKKGFKKGVKLTGTALKQVVGNVKPSYVQRYSDDEKSPSQLPVVSRFVRSVEPELIPAPLFPALATPQRTVTANSARRQRNKAREIGPEDEWSETESHWKTPMTELPPSRKQSPPQEIHRIMVTTSPVVIDVVSARESPEPPVQEPVVTPSRVESQEPVRAEEPVIVEDPQAGETSLLMSPNSLLMNLPSDLLSFDFKFEGDDEYSTPPRLEQGEPFDLLRQMFTQIAAPSEPAGLTREDEPPVEPVTVQLNTEERVYSVPFLLSVLKEMKSSQTTHQLAVPLELAGLSELSPSFVKQNKTSDLSGWRANERTSPNTPEHPHGGSWRASGYNHKVNSKRVSPPAAAAAEEGFW